MATGADPERLYPAAETREMLAIIGNSGGEIGALRGPVEQGTVRVREMLGDYATVAAAASAWGEHAPARLRAAPRFIEAAGPALAGHWSGEAYRAYQGYERTVLGRAGDTVEQAQHVAEVLAEVRAVVAEQYRAATTALAALASGVIGLAGGRGYLPRATAGELARLAYRFVTDVDESIDLVIETLDAGRDRLTRVNEAATGSGPGQVAAWRPRSTD